jgi:phosphatidylinositol alpha-1,6-mannosyltransferase
MKKVLLLTHEYYPFAGGVATYCYNLFKNLSADNYIVLTDCPEVKTSGNIIQTKLLTTYIWPHWLIGLWSVMRLVKKSKIEIIFTPNILPLGTIAYFVKKLFGIPYIISLHGLDINLALKNKPVLTKKILLDAKGVICNTKFTASLIKGLVVSDKVSIIYPSVSLNQESVSAEQINNLRKKYNLNDEKVILTVGRLVSRKGHALVIKALKKLSDIRLKYFIVGEGPEKNHLEQLIKEAKLEDRVFILSKVSNTELPLFYQLANIFILPNQAQGADVEGFGIVFLEAASFHLPIIAGSSGGVQEVFTGQGDVIYADDETAIIQALRELGSDEQKRLVFGQQSYRRSEYFKQIAKDNIKLLANILS